MNLSEKVRLEFTQIQMAENSFSFLTHAQESKPGVDVMITQKLAFFSKSNVMIKILHNLALF
jgi:hypothetical protein